MAIVSAVLLVLVIFIRPQEFIPLFEQLSILNVLTALSIVGIAIEFGQRRFRNTLSPQLPYFLAFLAWAFIATFASLKMDAFNKVWRTVGFSSIFMAVVMFASRTPKRLVVMTGTLCCIAGFLIFVGTSQATSSFECIEVDASEEESDLSNGEPIGKSCVFSSRDCINENDKSTWNKEYLCEKIGFNSFSIGHGRVRWRGILADPNELSLAIGAALAFVFGLHGLMKNALRHLLLAAMVVGAGYVVIQSQSRGGLLVLMGVFGTYFVKRFGAKGFVLGAVMAAPLLLLGGREGEEANASTAERIEALYEGINMIKEHPIVGVGLGQFNDYYTVTAHNAYLLTASELGLPGMFLWSQLLYVSLKIPLKASFYPPREMDQTLRSISFALLVAFVGICIGITFLSFAYHNMLYIYFGVSGALFGAIRQIAPDFEVKVSTKERVRIFMGDLAILFLIFVYSRLKI